MMNLGAGLRRVSVRVKGRWRAIVAAILAVAAVALFLLVGVLIGRGSRDAGALPPRRALAPSVVSSVAAGRSYVAITAVDGKAVGDGAWIPVGSLCCVDGVAGGLDELGGVTVGLAVRPATGGGPVHVLEARALTDQGGQWSIPAARPAAGQPAPWALEAVLLDGGPSPGPYGEDEWEAFALATSSPVHLAPLTWVASPDGAASVPGPALEILSIGGAAPDPYCPTETFLGAPVSVTRCGLIDDTVVRLVLRPSGSTDPWAVMPAETLAASGRAPSLPGHPKGMPENCITPHLDVAAVVLRGTGTEAQLSQGQLDALAVAVSSLVQLYVPELDPAAWAAHISVEYSRHESITKACWVGAARGRMAGTPGPDTTSIFVLSSPGDSGLWFGPVRGCRAEGGGEWFAEAECPWRAAVGVDRIRMVAVVALHDLEGRALVEQEWRSLALAASQIVSVPLPAGTFRSDRGDLRWIGAAARGHVRGERPPTLRGLLGAPLRRGQSVWLVRRKPGEALWTNVARAQTESTRAFVVRPDQWADGDPLSRVASESRCAVMALLCPGDPPVKRADGLWWDHFALAATRPVIVDLGPSPVTRAERFFGLWHNPRWLRLGPALAATLGLLVVLVIGGVKLALHLIRLFDGPGPPPEPEGRQSMVRERETKLGVVLALVGVVAMVILWPFYSRTVATALAFGEDMGMADGDVPLEARGLAAVLMIYTAVAGVLMHMGRRRWESARSPADSWIAVALMLPAPVLAISVALIYDQAISASIPYVGLVLGLFVSMAETGIFFVAVSLWLREDDDSGTTPDAR